MKTNAHTIYRLADGSRVPGVTTITGQLNKPALLRWAWNLGTQGIDYTKFRDDKAEIGSLCHRIILDYFRKEETDTSDYSKNQIDAAENAFLSFLEWEKQYRIKPIVIEKPLVSEIYRFGGTPDLYGMVNEEPELLDFKTGSGIYREMWYQMAGYSKILFEHGQNVTKVRILNIPRTEDDAFKEETKTDLHVYWEGFFNLLQFYYCDKQAK